MAKLQMGGSVGRTIILAADEAIGCPKCGHGFPLSEGISRQTIERHAEDYERALTAGKKRLEAELAAEAKRRAEREAAAAHEKSEVELKATREALASRESALEKFRSDELTLRRQLRALEDKAKSQDLDYQRRLGEETRRIETKARASAVDEFSRREAQLKAQIESAQRDVWTC